MTDSVIVHSKAASLISYGSAVKQIEFRLFHIVLPRLTAWRSGQVLWTWTGRTKTLPPSTSLLVVGEIAGVNTASLGGCLHSSKTRAKWVQGFHNELNGHTFDLERDGLHQVVLCL